MTSTDDLADPMADLRAQIREAVVGAECERTPTCPDCITASVLTVISATNPPAPAPSDVESEVEHDDGACTRCGDTEGDIWPIAGRPGYFCRPCVITLTGVDPTQPV